MAAFAHRGSKLEMALKSREKLTGLSNLSDEQLIGFGD
jgi:hypothetical protein